MQGKDSSSVKCIASEAYDGKENAAALLVLNGKPV